MTMTQSASSVLLACLLWSMTALTSYATPDSLRVEKNKGKQYIIHRVDPKETLYSISRRYEVSIDKIYEHNPQIEDGLKMYTELKLPYDKKLKKVKANTIPGPVISTPDFHIVKAGETLYSIARAEGIDLKSLKSVNNLYDNSISPGDTLILKPQIKADPALTMDSDKSDSNSDIHVVQHSETLYSISRKYSISVDSLKQWNSLADNNLSIGQSLLISKSSQNNGLASTLKKTVNLAPSKKTMDTIYVHTDNSEFHTRKENAGGNTIIAEEGFAMKINGTDFTTKYLALHKTAPMGSKVRIKNQMTNKEITVQVVGYLPNSAVNQGLLMRLSDAAYKGLGGIDSKIPVTSKYQE